MVKEKAEKESIEMSWTPEQWDAITLRDNNYLVAAAAGSGKTSVLVERIKKMVCEEGVAVDNLLVVTFTKAAAAEMKERIRAALVEAISEAEVGSKESADLRKQLRHLSDAQISTFHAFGMSVIKRFFYLTDVDPSSRIADDTEKGILMEQAMESLLEEEFEKSSPDFIRFMDNYSGDRNSNSAVKLLKKAYKELTAMPNAWSWAEDRLKEMESIQTNFSESVFWRLMLQDMKEKLGKADEAGSRAYDILMEIGLEEKAKDLKVNEVGRYRIANEIVNSWDGSEEIESMLKRLKEALDNKTGGFRITVGKKNEHYEDYNEIKNALSSARDEAKAATDKYVYPKYLETPFQDLLDEIKMDAVELRTLVRLTKRFADIYAELKADMGVMDFDDIEHYSLAILGDETAAEYYKNKFRYIFVDEYQDTNLMQEAIIEKIRGENNLFMVGDIKQSIYKFRLAEPSIFQGKYQGYKRGEVPLSQVIDLNRNHRSKSTIIHFINEIFRPIMENYDEDAELKAGIEYEGELLREPEVRLLIPDRETSVGNESSDEDAEVQEEWDSVYVEARHVAELIKENLGKPFYDSKGKPNGERPLRKRDIVVLMRSVSKYASLYSQALQEMGIDAYLEGDDGYFDTLEIGAFINLLEIIDNLQQDVPLISVLHSAMFGFTAKELGKIRALSKRGSFSSAFLNVARRAPEVIPVKAVDEEEYKRLSEKSAKALERIILWRNMALTMSLEKYIWYLMTESQCYVLMGALPKGAARQSNLRALCDMAEAYTKGRQVTLYDFLSYVRAIKAGRIKTPEASAVGEGDDVVRIMTIHKSKGLEFPMVILSGLGSKKEYGKGSTFSFHKDIGMALTLKSGKGHWKKTILIQSLIKAQVEKEELAEEIRILYVGLTRARDILYLVGYMEGKPLERLLENAEKGLRSTDSYLDMIAPTVALKKINVDVTAKDEEPEPIKVESIKYSGELSREEKKRIISQLKYVYPYQEEQRQKSKYSVSELNHKEMERKKRHIVIYDQEVDEGEVRFDAAEKGTIYHKILEVLDFGEAAERGRDYIDKACEDLAENNIVSEEEFKAIDMQKIYQFFESELGKRSGRAARAGTLQKERIFTLKMKKGKSDILVQGIIDGYFREEGPQGRHTVLFDYKSNKIDKNNKEAEVNRLRELYSHQLSIYKEALTEAGLGPVDETYLYLLDIDLAVRV